MERVSIFCSDCVSGMKQLPEYSVDCIIADYPTRGVQGWEHYFSLIEQTAQEYRRLLKPNGNLLLINTPLNWYNTVQYFSPHFRIRNTVVVPLVGAVCVPNHLAFTYRSMLMLYRGKYAYCGDTTDLYDFEADDSYMYVPELHSYLLSPMFAEQYINLLTKPGGVIMEPFMGYGVIAQKAAAMNRRYIGFDHNIECCDYVQNKIWGSK